MVVSYHRSWELNPDTLEEHSVLLTTEPSLQTPLFCFVCVAFVAICMFACGWTHSYVCMWRLKVNAQCFPL